MNFKSLYGSRMTTAPVLLGAILVPIFFGMAIVLFPIGFFARLFLIFASLFAIVIAWISRVETNQAPDRLVFFWMILIVALSVIWPRYIFLNIGMLPRINPLTVSVMLGVGLVLFLMVNSPEFWRRVVGTMRRGGWIFKLIVMWFAWRFVANILGEYPLDSTVNFVREMFYISSFVLFGTVIASYDNGPNWMLRVVILTAVLVGLAGVIEAFQHSNLFVRFASQSEEGDLASTLANIAMKKIRLGEYRAQSTFDHPIVFAQFFAALMPLAFFAFLHEKHRFWRLLSFAVIPIALLAILKSGSRAGIISFAIAAAFLGLLFWVRALAHGRLSKATAIIALPALAAAISIAFLVLQEIAGGRSQIEAGSTNVRFLMLHYGMHALSQSPLWGFGHGLAITKAGITNPSGLITLDNYLLTVALDSGFIGFALFVATITAFALKGFAFSIRQRGLDGMFVGACVASVLALFSTFAILSIPNNMTLLWLLITATFPFFGLEENKHYETRFGK